MLFDLAKEFEEFYRLWVVLPLDSQNDLRTKREANVRRLRSGLEEYNKAHGTSYCVAETLTQGSMAMHTVIQSDVNDYDIDVAVIFDSANISNLSPLQVRRIVAEAINRRRGNLREDPEVKTNCVRVKYSNGYHVDFAVYRKTKQIDGTYFYEHGGSDWRPRDPKAIANWFSGEIGLKGTRLREAVRLLKTFSKSRSFWVMPGGLIQTVLSDERFDPGYDRLDETFYYLMNEIKDRLANSTEVFDPTDSALSLLLKKSDQDKVVNLRTRLDTFLTGLNVLFESSCNKTQACLAWQAVFNSDFWNPDSLTESVSLRKNESGGRPGAVSNTEQFIEDQVNINEIYDVEVECEASGRGFRTSPIREYLSKAPEGFLPHNLSLRFFIKKCSVPKPYDVWWKVRNVGPEAETRGCVRGGLLKTNGAERRESTSFYGPHYVECYIIKDGVCVAIGHIEVPIGRS
jgi:hypothetical protein